MTDQERLCMYAYFHGQVKGWVEAVTKEYAKPEEAIAALKAAEEALSAKLRPEAVEK